MPSIAAAIGEPARARMLYCLLDGRARTATELAVVADVSPSTASVHLQRLRAERLVSVVAQGKHRYYSLDGPTVAAALEALSVLAGGERTSFKPTAPDHLRSARTCYDHIAGAVGVALHDRFAALKWLTPVPDSRDGYDLVPAGAARLTALGVEIAAARVLAPALRLCVPRLERAAAASRRIPRRRHSRARVTQALADAGVG